MTETSSEKIIEKLKSNKVKDAYFTQFCRDLVSNLKDKQQKVILHRFGLSGRKRLTLDAIGKDFGVTRERVRQIEVASLAKLRKLANLEHNKPHLDRIKNIIEDNGGVVSENKMVSELISDLDEKRSDELKKILRFVLLLNEDIQMVEDGEHTNSGWALARYNKKMLEDIAKAFADVLNEKGEVMEDETILLEILKHETMARYKSDITKGFLQSSIDLAKKLHKTEDGKRGLTTWSWVKPKTIRDKIFFVLSKKNEPMHFSDIAEAINQASFDHKKATLQTIHNELISDDRFILVGRGLYGLANWGFEGGTVEDVIEKILKKEGKPMEQLEVVEEVMKKKKVKKATVLINLQNSPKFKKTAEGYILVENK